jgi:hypothetical protein
MICASFTGVSLRSYANSVKKIADLLGLTNLIPFNWPGLFIGTVSLLSQLSRQLLKIVNRKKKKKKKQKTRDWCLMETWNREMNGSQLSRQLQTKGKSEERIIVINIERVVSPF